MYWLPAARPYVNVYLREQQHDVEKSSTKDCLWTVVEWSGVEWGGANSFKPSNKIVFDNFEMWASEAQSKAKELLE